MSCPSLGRLAAAASGEDALAIVHAEACVRCGALLAEQQELVAAARGVRAPRLSDERRRVLAAEVMAGADVALEPRWRGGRVMLGAVGLSAAAIAAVVLASLWSMRSPGAPDLAETLPSAREATTVDIRAVAHEHLAPPPLHRFAEVVAHGADYARAADADRDVVRLREGELAIDARDRDPVTVVAGDTSVVIARSSAKVVARGGVIVTAQVFAGTAEITTHGRRRVVDEGEVWVPSKRPAPSVPSTGFEAFRGGWEALRDARYADAIEAFDRATDPGVAEDAAFWAAIACERAGQLDAAARRLGAFVERFPSSPRIEAARAALQRVAR